MTPDVLAPALRLLSRTGANEITIGRAAIEDWPPGVLDALLNARIITAAPVAQSTTCPGCSRGCMMDICRLGAAGQTNPSDYVVCDKSEDYGIIGIDHASLQQWRCSRPGLIDFLATELGLRAKDADAKLGRIQFGTSKRLKRSIALEFSHTPELRIGDDRHELADFLIWDGIRIRLDWDFLHALADRAAVMVLGEKQYQRSTIKRENRKNQTKLRDQQLQVAVEQLRADHPQWNKERIAREIEKSREFKKVSWQRIMRVTRVRK